MEDQQGSLESSFHKSPLSWGVSSLALAYHTGSEALLKSVDHRSIPKVNQYKNEKKDDTNLWVTDRVQKN